MIAPLRGVARRQLPIGGDASGLVMPSIFALIVYVGALAGVGMLVTGATLRAAAGQLGDKLTLAVPVEDSPARLQTILALLRQTAGIASVRPLTATETARLLEPWLGPAAPLGDLPVPHLVDLTAAPGRTIDLKMLQQHLRSVAPDAMLDDHRAALGRMRVAARRVELVLGGIVIGALLVAAGIAVFAAGLASSGQRPAIELLHQLGATDRAVAGSFALRALAGGLLGGAIGGLCLLATVAVLRAAHGAAMLPAPVVAPGLGEWRIWAITVGAAVTAGAIAMAGAYAVMRRRLAALP